MKKIVFLGIFIFSHLVLSAQQLELGLGGGVNTFSSFSTDDDYVIEKNTTPGAYAGLYSRYINEKNWPGLRHLEFGAEYYTGHFYSSTHSSGNSSLSIFETDIRQKKTSLSLTAYALNFRTLQHRFQVGLGLNINFALQNRTYGYYSVTAQQYNPYLHRYYWGTVPRQIAEINASEMNKFVGNLALTFAYISKILGTWSFKPRLTILCAFTSETKGDPDWYFPSDNAWKLVFHGNYLTINNYEEINYLPIIHCKYAKRLSPNH